MGYHQILISHYQNEQNDLDRYRNLLKEASEILTALLYDKNLMELSTTITFYWTKENVMLPFFTGVDNLTFSLDVKGLLEEMELQEYDTKV